MKKKTWNKPKKQQVIILFLTLFSLELCAVNLPKLDLGRHKNTKPAQSAIITKEDRILFPNFARDYAKEASATKDPRVIPALKHLQNIKNNRNYSSYDEINKNKNVLSRHLKNSMADGTGLPVFEMKILRSKNLDTRSYSITKLYSIARGSSAKSLQLLKNVISNESYMTLLASQFARTCGVQIPQISSWGYFSDFNNEDDRFNPIGYITMNYLDPREWRIFGNIQCPRSAKAIVAKVIYANSCLQKQAGIFHNDIYIAKETIHGLSEEINKGNLMLKEGHGEVTILDFGEAIPTLREKISTTRAMSKMRPCDFFKETTQRKSVPEKENRNANIKGSSS